MIPKYGKNLRLCYMYTDSLIYNIEVDDFYEDIAGNVKARFNTSNFSEDCPLPKGKNKKVIGLMNGKLGGRIMTEFVVPSPKYEVFGRSGSKRCKGIRKCLMRKMRSFDDYEQCLLSGQHAFWKQLMFWNKKHKLHMFKANKVTPNRP